MALSGVAGFCFIGLFTAVAPAFLSTVLGHPGPLLAGLVVAAVFARVSSRSDGSPGLPDRVARRVGCGALATGTVVVAGSLWLGSVWLFLVGTILAGAADWGDGVEFAFSERAGRSKLLAKGSFSAEESRKVLGCGMSVLLL